MAPHQQIPEADHEGSRDLAELQLLAELQQTADSEQQTADDEHIIGLISLGFVSGSSVSAGVSLHSFAHLFLIFSLCSQLSQADGNLNY